MKAIRVSREQAAKLGIGKTSKYRAIKTTIGDITFDSRKEAKRWQDLVWRESFKQISELKIQPSFPLTVNGIKVGVYRADFSYRENGRVVIEDVKGFKTPLYRWKKKHFEAQYGIQIQEV